MRKLFGAGLAVLTMAALAGHGALAAGYALRTLPSLGPTQPSLAHVMTPSGVAIGESTVNESCPLSQWVACLVDGHTDKQPRAVLWTAHDREPRPLRCLDTTLAPNASWDLPCEAASVNSHGTMVGRSYAGFAAEGRQRPVLWRHPMAAAVDLTPRLEGLPEYDSARAVGINDFGWVLGRARHKGSAAEYAFLLRGKQAQLLSGTGAVAVRPVAINNQIAIGEGRYDEDGQSGVVIWSLEGGATALRSISSPVDHVYASGLSAAGHITGAYWAPLGGHNTQAYLWYQGRAQSLPTDPGHDSRGHSVNAAGQVVGTHCAPGQDIRGCRATLWEGGIRHDLNRMATPPAGHVLVDARSINDHGQIVGWMMSPSGRMHGFLLNPLP